jgi:peptidyl-prolyl cis-trans isomerase-like protein 2
MGKKRHSKDRLFITTTEHKYEWGGKKDPIKTPYSKLPYNCCALSLLPFENPICTKEGIIFDIVNILPFIKKYKKNPVNWEPLEAKDLVKLHIHKNDKGEYHDPVTYKVFTEHTHIVAIANTGNVYAYDTIEELNRQPKNWKDLLTDQPFSMKDVITIQDPKNLERRQVSNFQYIQKDIDLASLKGPQADVKDPNNFINQNSITKKTLSELEQKHPRPKPADDEEFKEPLGKKLKTDVDVTDKKEINQLSKAPVAPKVGDKDAVTPAQFVAEKIKKGLAHGKYTSGQVSTAFTSTAMDVSTDNSTRKLNEDEIRKAYVDIVKSKQLKGYMQILTNLGPLDLQIYCDYAPKTGENFLELCEKKYYNGTCFHRLVRNFVLQGGDPTGTGKGGDSIFGGNFNDEFHPKLTHDRPGILSMANSGKNTNKSQFFISLKACKHLDEKHSIFGEVVGGLVILEKINHIPCDAKEKPSKKIEILDTIVFTNPYRDAIKELLAKEKIANDKVTAAEVLKSKSGERWILSK